MLDRMRCYGFLCWDAGREILSGNWWVYVEPLDVDCHTRLTWFSNVLDHGGWCH